MLTATLPGCDLGALVMSFKQAMNNALATLGIPALPRM